MVRYGVVFREKKRKPQMWSRIGIDWAKKPTKKDMERIGFGFIYDKKFEMKILPIRKRKN